MLIKRLSLHIFRNYSYLYQCGMMTRLTHCFHSRASVLRTSERSQSSKINLQDFPLERIRNFSIIAHVDHGKSTLADRILEVTGAISSGEDNRQVLDTLQVERERGITVKAQTASVTYDVDGKSYLLNLIDTPGHVDFSFEVTRSLAACDGVILLVDAKQGVQAQTMANFYLAFAEDMVIIPVINKVDLKDAKIEIVCAELEELFEIDPDEVLKVSAKTGYNVKLLLETVIKRVPPPSKCNVDGDTRFRLLDSWYDQYRGAINLIQVVDGRLKVGDPVISYKLRNQYIIKDLGFLSPNESKADVLYTGQVGYMTCNMRDSKEAVLGDTFYSAKYQGDVQPLTEIREVKPMIFSGFYPENQSLYPQLKSSVERLQINDRSVQLVSESSLALGQGWRAGFLGVLHLEVFMQRLEQEFDATVVATTPSVPYKLFLSGKKLLLQFNGKEEVFISNPNNWPEIDMLSNVKEIQEPMIRGSIITPVSALKQIVKMCMDRRGEELDTSYIHGDRAITIWRLPLNEILTDFFDEMKHCTSGYASFDYEDEGYQKSNVVKIDILLNGIAVPEFSTIAHVSKAREVGRRIVHRIVELVPRQLYEVAVQASIQNQIVARGDIKALRKDVLAKCYGGDITRKAKLLKLQAKGKKKMKTVGKINIPKEIFIKVLQK